MMDQSTVEEDEYSDCSRDSSSSELTTSSGSSASMQETSRKQFESTKITTEIINLPKELCEDKAVFKEFFSLETWHSLSDPIRKHLNLFLPMFTDNIEFEKNSTIESLLTNRLTRFGSCPLERLQHSLEEGNCRPEISTLNKSIAKAERREQRFQESERLTELARKVAISRERTLRKVCQSNAQSNDLLSRQYVYSAKSPLFSSANALRAKKRYLQEITSVAEQLCLPDILSDDEKCSEAVSNYIPRKQRRLFGTVQGGAASPGADVRIVNTLGFKDEQTTTGYLVGPNGKISIGDSHYRDLLVHHKRRKYEEPDHPELDCQEIKLKDVVVRTQASSGYRRIMPLPKINVTEEALAAVEEKINLSKCQDNITPTPTYPESCSSGDLKISITKSSEHDIAKSVDPNTLEVCNSDDSISLNHTADSTRAVSEPEVYIKTIRLDSDREVENFTSGISDVRGSDVGENDTSVQSVALMDDRGNSNADVSSEMVDSFRPIKESQIPEKIEIETENPVGRSTPNLETIQISNMEEDNNSSLLEKPQDEEALTSINLIEQELNDASRQSMVQSFEKSSYEKATPELMQETHKCFLSLLRDMFCSTPDHRLTIEDLQLKLNDWLKTPIAALNDWYLQADDKWDDMLQSAILFLSGEFSDQPDDFVPYIEHKVQLNIYQWIGASRDSDHRLLDLCQYWLRRRHEMGIRAQSKPMKAISSKQKYASSNSSTTVEDDDGSSERTISPPPPRYPTDWSVRKATDEEVQLFREQERRRYENPHMSFTYKQHSYNSVVGPVKGIYTQVPGISKARGHNMLVADRPNFVTILTLVRDATARLPNGEGTRADICELLKSSQYISPTATDQVLQTIVSGALDRMHTEHDPCVKYDTKRKIWIYLHRSRTEAEFERLHHQYQGVAKHKKPVYRKTKPKEATAASPRKAVSEPLIKSNSQSSLENDSLHSEPTPEIGSLSTNTIESPISLTSPSLLVKSNLSTVIANDKTTFSNSLPSLILSQKPVAPQQSINENSLVIQQTSTEPPMESPTRIELKEKDTPKVTACTSSPIVSQINKETVPIRVSSACKIQAVQLSNTQPHIIARPVKPTQQSDINSDAVGPKSILTKKIITTVPAKPVVLTSTPSTVASFGNISGGIPVQVSMAGSAGNGDHIAHSFIVPVTLSAESGNARARLIPSTSHISVSKPNRVQSVQQATPVTVKATSLLQTKNPMSLLSQLPSTGKCVVQPEAFIVAANRQQKVTSVSASSNNSMTSSSTAVLLKSEGGTPTSGVDIINTITMPKGQQSVLTPAQQKQILQNLLAQQNKQVFTSKPVIIGQSVTSNANTTCFVNSSNVTTSAQGIQQVKGARQLQKIPALTLSSSSARGTPTVFQTIGSNVGGPHVIQIKAASNMLSGTSGAKIRPIITTLKEHTQTKQLQQSLIAKPANFPLKSDVQEINAVKTSSNVTVVSEIPKASSTIVQSAVPGAPVTHMVKSAASMVHPTPNVIRTVNVTQGAPHVMAKVLKGGENQFVSLDSLIPRQQIGDAAIRLTEPKTMKTQLIHLSSSGPSGTPIAQYTVVPQNRNIISVAQPSGHCTTPTIITTTANRVSDPKTSQILVTSHNTVTSVSQTPVTSTAHRIGAESSTSLMQSVHAAQSQLQQQNAPQIVTKLPGTPKMLSAKVRNGTSFINSSSINFATIGGNPLIIASKPAIRSDTIQHNGTSTVFQSSPIAPESANIVYGRQAVKVQGNIVSQGHVNIVNAQQGSNTTTQKLVLSNQLVKVRAVPRQPHQMQISFAQQPGLSSGLSPSAGISVVKTQGITTDQQEKPTLSNVSPKPTMLATPVKAPQKVGIRLNQPTQRVVLATQGGQLVTQQIIVPQGFQGGAFNIKRLKVIPVSSQQKGSILRPQVVTTQQKPASSSINTATSLAVSDASIEGNSKLYHVFNNSASSSNNLKDTVELNMDPNMK